MAVIADLYDYPEWTSGLESVIVHASDELGRPLSATFVGSIGPVKDSYTVGYDWAAAEVSWHLTEGDKITGLEGKYTCVDLGDGSTDVVYHLTVETAIPMVGMVRRKGEKMIVDAALKGLKRYVEG